MLEKFESEKRSSPDFKEFSNELNDYLSRKIAVNNPKLARDLEQKLKDGKREDILDFAKETKNKINRKIGHYGLFRTANDVFVFLLSNIRATFITRIQSKIRSKDFKSYEIDDLISEHIIDKLWEDCQISTLFDDFDELYGLLYLLTGNCHIDWDIEI
ncbi:hypothetical protein EOL70_24905 [Leucothrix sargassi]|nr:hypothetical protein EOL70_24905 [Leucothrix sargassi]